MKLLIAVALISLSPLMFINQAGTNELAPDIHPLHNLVNEVRSNAELNELHPNTQLNNSAALKCADMQSQGYWGHGDWKKFITVNYQKAGENLAKNYPTDQETVTAWQESPKHNDNLLGDYTDVGYATCEGQLGTVTVQHFIKEAK